MELMLMGRYRLLIIKIFGELDQHKARLGGINIKKTEELIWIMRFCTKV